MATRIAGIGAAARNRFDGHHLADYPELDALVVHYQPVVNLQTSQVVGFEALVRWEHPERGLLFPKDFLADAVRTGFVSQLGHRVRQIAVRQLAEWQRVFPTQPRRWVSVNVSAHGLGSSDITHSLRSVLDATHVDPSSLILEITETSLLESGVATVTKLQELKEIGVGLALDDFGTGYSSLSYLRQFPFDYIKIDASFTAGLPTDHRSMLLADASLHVADAFGLVGIAEGIERLDQADALKGMGWRLGQGYLFAHPASAKDITALLAAPAGLHVEAEGTGEEAAPPTPPNQRVPVARGRFGSHRRDLHHHTPLRRFLGSAPENNLRVAIEPPDPGTRPLDTVDLARDLCIDLDALFVVGVTGIYTSELLFKIRENGQHVVGAFVTMLNLTGGVRADQLEELLDIGIDRVLHHGRKFGRFEPTADDLLDVVRQH